MPHYGIVPFKVIRPNKVEQPCTENPIEAALTKEPKSHVAGSNKTNSGLAGSAPNDPTIPCIYRTLVKRRTKTPGNWDTRLVTVWRDP